MKQTASTPPLSDVLTDVTIREGSQQAGDLRQVGVQTKLSLLELIVGIGVRRVELTAFAPGDWFSDADELVRGVLPWISENITLRALYFNARGLEQMLKHSAIAREGIFHTAATPTYRLKNYSQQSPEHALEKMAGLLEFFRKHGLQFNTLALSTAWGDREETISENQTLAYLGQLLAAAQKQGFPVQSLTLADTAGCAAPESLESLIKKVKTTWPEVRVRVHLHPEPQKAEASIHACLEGGVQGWEAAWGGLGGSPFAAGAGGNLDIRWLVKVYRQRGLDPGFNLEEIHPTLRFLRQHADRSIPDVPW